MDPGEEIPDSDQSVDELMGEVYPLRPMADLQKKKERAAWFNAFLEETEETDQEIREHVTGLYEDEKILLNRDRTPRKERNAVEVEKDLTASRLALWNSRLLELKITVGEKCREPGGKGILDSDEYRGTVMLFETKVAGLRMSATLNSGEPLASPHPSDLAPITPAKLPRIECSLQELKGRKTEWDVFADFAARLPNAREKVKWALSVSPESWQDQDRAQLVGVHPKTFSKNK